MSLKGLSNKELASKRSGYWQNVKDHADKIDNANSIIKAGYKDTKSKAKYKNAKKSLVSLKKRKASSKQNYQRYDEEYQSRSNQATRAKERKNSYQVAKKVNQSPKYTSIYRADHATNTVINLVETDPNESVSFDVANESIDEDSSQSTNVGTQPINLSGSYYIIGYSDKERNRQYNQLRRWKGVELVVDGFTHWQNTLLTSISKSTTQENSANTLTLNLNFQNVTKAKIQYAKQTKNAKRKPKAKAQTGTHSGSSSYVKVKPNMTLAQISSEKGVSISELKRLNKTSSTELKAKSKVRLS